MRTEDNGDLIINFGPAAPDGHDGNWIQTRAGKGWFPILRIYGPLEALVRQDLATRRDPTRRLNAAPRRRNSGA